MTETTAVAELLPGTGSVPTDATLPVLAGAPSIKGAAVMVIVASPVFVIVPKAQVTIPSAWAHAPWLLCADTKAMLAGNGSVTTRPNAEVGPRFVTEIVYTTLLVTTTIAGKTVFPMARSAGAFTVVTTVAVLLAEFGSMADEVAVAELVIHPPCCGLTVIVAVLVAPLDRGRGCRSRRLGIE